MLFCDRGGEGEALLVLLHGLGATRAVWQPMLADIDKHWRGRWLAIDMPGHGKSAGFDNFLPGAQAAAIASLIRHQQVGGRHGSTGLVTLGADGVQPPPPAEPAVRQDVSNVVLFGHSMGGTISLALASGWFGIRPRAVLGLGIKMAWSEAELDGMAAQAAKPAKLFDSKEAAVERFLKVSGLYGLVDPQSPMALSGVKQEQGPWCLAMDPRANEIGPPILPGMMDAAICPVHLAAGSEDAMCRVEDLRRWDPEAASLPGLSHNAMVQDPAAVWRWAAPYLEA